MHDGYGDASIVLLFQKWLAIAKKGELIFFNHCGCYEEIECTGHIIHNGKCWPRTMTRNSNGKSVLN